MYVYVYTYTNTYTLHIHVMYTNQCVYTLISWYIVYCSAVTAKVYAFNTVCRGFETTLGTNLVM